MAAGKFTQPVADAMGAATDRVHPSSPFLGGFAAQHPPPFPPPTKIYRRRPSPLPAAALQAQEAREAMPHPQAAAHGAGDWIREKVRLRCRAVPAPPSPPCLLPRGAPAQKPAAATNEEIKLQKVED